MKAEEEHIKGKRTRSTTHHLWKGGRKGGWNRNRTLDDEEGRKRVPMREDDSMMDWTDLKRTFLKCSCSRGAKGEISPMNFQNASYDITRRRRRKRNGEREEKEQKNEEDERSMKGR